MEYIFQSKIDSTHNNLFDKKTSYLGERKALPLVMHTEALEIIFTAHRKRCRGGRE